MLPHRLLDPFRKLEVLVNEARCGLGSLVENEPQGFHGRGIEQLPSLHDFATFCEARPHNQQDAVTQRGDLPRGGHLANVGTFYQNVGEPAPKQFHRLRMEIGWNQLAITVCFGKPPYLRSTFNVAVLRSRVPVHLSEMGRDQSIDARGTGYQDSLARSARHFPGDTLGNVASSR